MGRITKFSEAEVRSAISSAGTLRGAARLLGVAEANIRYYAKKYNINDAQKDDDFFMSQREVAAALGITVHAVIVAERSAMAKLRKSKLMGFAHGR